MNILSHILNYETKNFCNSNEILNEPAEILMVTLIYHLNQILSYVKIFNRNFKNNLLNQSKNYSQFNMKVVFILFLKSKI